MEQSSAGDAVIHDGARREGDRRAYVQQLHLGAARADERRVAPLARRCDRRYGTERRRNFFAEADLRRLVPAPIFPAPSAHGVDVKAPTQATS